MVRVLLRINLCGLIAIDVALADVVAVVFAGASWVLAPADVGRPSFPCSRPCSSRRLGIVPSGSSVALGSVEMVETSFYLAFWRWCQVLLGTLRRIPHRKVQWGYLMGNHFLTWFLARFPQTMSLVRFFH